MKSAKTIDNPTENNNPSQENTTKVTDKNESTRLDTTSNVVQPHDGQLIVPFGLRSSIYKNTKKLYSQMLFENKAMDFT